MIEKRGIVNLHAVKWATEFWQHHREVCEQGEQNGSYSREIALAAGVSQGSMVSWLTKARKLDPPLVVMERQPSTGSNIYRLTPQGESIIAQFPVDGPMCFDCGALSDPDLPPWPSAGLSKYERIRRPKCARCARESAERCARQEAQDAEYSEAWAREHREREQQLLAYAESLVARIDEAA